MTYWVLKEVVLAIHEEQLAEHGGATGVRDENALGSALGRPENFYHFTDPKPDVFELAARYAFGIANNHPFVDGNKRTSLAVTATFLILNGYNLVATAEETKDFWLEIAAGQKTDDDITLWLRDHCRTRP